MGGRGGGGAWFRICLGSHKVGVSWGTVPAPPQSLHPSKCNKGLLETRGLGQGNLTLWPREHWGAAQTRTRGFAPLNSTSVICTGGQPAPPAKAGRVT